MYLIFNDLHLFLEDVGISEMDWEQEENAAKLTSKKEYDCVICNQTTPSSEDKPMGLVALVQVMYFLLVKDFLYESVLYIYIRITFFL